MNPEQVFLDTLPHIDRTIAFVCRRHGLYGADADDFGATVKLRLIEDDYAVIRRFKQESSLPTYLTVIIQRWYLDLWVNRHGRWRPSAEAQRLGDAAALLEILIHREGRPVDEARRLVLERHPSLSSTEIDTMLGRLPARKRRPLFEDATDEVLVDSATPPDAEERLMATDRERTAARVSKVLSDAIVELTAEERLILRMRYGDGTRVADIASSLHLDQKQLYRRFDDLLRRLQRKLKAEPLARRDLADLVAHGADGLQVDFDDSGGKSPAKPTTTSRGDEHLLTRRGDSK